MANLKVKEMTEVIKKQIEAYTKDTKLESIGSVLSVGDGIAIVYGLKDAMMGELLVFPHFALVSTVLRKFPLILREINKSN